MADNTYNGWKNWATWNVALWLNNDEDLYRIMSLFVRTTHDPDYEGLADTLTAHMAGTPDGAAWNDPEIDTDALDEMIAELYEELRG